MKNIGKTKRSALKLFIRKNRKNSNRSQLNITSGFISGTYWSKSVTYYVIFCDLSEQKVIRPNPGQLFKDFNRKKFGVWKISYNNFNIMTIMKLNNVLWYCYTKILKKAFSLRKPIMKYNVYILYFQRYVRMPL